MQRIVFHEDLFLLWPGVFFIGMGLLLQHNGVERFPLPGRNGQSPTMASPAMLYWLGMPWLFLAVLRAVLFRIERAKEQKKTLQNPSVLHRRASRRLARRRRQ
jgi:hypothetical protein